MELKKVREQNDTTQMMLVEQQRQILELEKQAKASCSY